MELEQPMAGANGDPGITAGRRLLAWPQRQLRVWLLPLSILLAGAGVVPAQDCTRFPAGDPGAGACNLIPFGATPDHPLFSDQRCQILVPATAVGSQTIGITELRFLPCGGGRRTFDRITVRIDQIQATRLSPTFAQNLTPQAVTVLDAREHSFIEQPGAFQALGLNGLYPFDPARGNLVVDIFVQGARLLADRPGGPGYRVGGVQRLYAYGFGSGTPATGFLDDFGPYVQICTMAGAVDAYGHGCGIPALTLSAGGTPHLGGQVDLLLSQGQPLAPAFYIFGFHDAPLLPLDLSPIGMPGCRLYVTVTETNAATLDGSARHRLQLPVPLSPRLVSARLHLQAVASDPAANRFGFVTSNYLRLLIGRAPGP